MSDDLRDRIAAVIHETETPLHDHGQALAQALIDDLGLVEERTVRVVDHGAGELRIPESRVVGKWGR